MSEIEREPFEPELIASLRADFTAVSPEDKDRVSQRLAHSIGASALGLPATPRPTPVAPSARLLPMPHAFGFIASFALGAAVSSGIHAFAARSEPPKVIYVAPTVPLASPSSSNAVTAQQEPARDAPAPAAPSSSASSVASRGSSVERAVSAGLAEQQALLDQARAAFAHGDYETTLTTLHKHFQEYPESLLGEEREALEIKTLAAVGRTEEAKARAARFSARFPQSLLLPSVNDSVNQNP